MRGLGASLSVDYTGDVAAQVRPSGRTASTPCCIGGGGAPAPARRAAQAWGGGVASINSRCRARGSRQSSPADAATLDRLAAEVAAGRLKMPIQRTYALDHVGEAFGWPRRRDPGQAGHLHSVRRRPPPRRVRGVRLVGESRIDEHMAIELGALSLSDLQRSLDTGTTATAADRSDRIVGYGTRAERLGLDVFALGEHHTLDFAVSSPSFWRGSRPAPTRGHRFESCRAYPRELLNRPP